MFNTKPWQNDSVVVNVLSWIRTVVIINLSGFVAKTTKEPRKLKTCFPSVPTCRIFSSWNDFIHTWGLQYKLRPLPKIQNGKERWSAHACMWKRNRRTSQLFDFESKASGARTSWVERCVSGGTLSLTRGFLVRWLMWFFCLFSLPRRRQSHI